jgi:hypothetical protein
MIAIAALSGCSDKKVEKDKTQAPRPEPGSLSGESLASLRQ